MQVGCINKYHFNLISGGVGMPLTQKYGVNDPRTTKRGTTVNITRTVLNYLFHTSF